MSKKEDTPFVIDFKSNKGNGSYGSASQLNKPNDGNSASTSSRAKNANILGTPRTPSKIYCLHGQERIEVRDHCHRTRSEGVDVKARKKLIIASVLCLFFMICEIVGGVLSNSLAIATDAAHLLTDFASFMISLFAIWLAGRPSTQRLSFGWYRAEVIGAMASVMMIWVITAILVWLAVQRVIYMDFELNASIMLITSGLAILVNLIMGFQLQHGHSHGGSSPAETIDCDHIETISSKPDALTAQTVETPKTSLLPDMAQSNDASIVKRGTVDNSAETVMQTTNTFQTFSYQNTTSVDELRADISAVMTDTKSAHGHAHGGGGAGKKRDAVNMNVRAAYIHVVGDMVQSVGVFVAALVIYFRPDWAIVDPICTFVFSIIVLITTFTIMKDALLVLMEGTPNYMHYNEVLNVFQNIEGVHRVHNLRIWALSINKIALSVHLAIDPDANPKKILQDATSAVHRRYNFFETTMQIEEYTPQMDDCNQCSVPLI